MKFLRTLLAVMLSLSIVLTIFVGRKKIKEGYNFGSAEEYKGIITIWQIDSFEGGVGSRKQFLLKVSRAFEKQNSGVLIMVINHTPETVKESFENGEIPDMISFGVGVEISNFTPIKNQLENKGGMVGKNVCAVPWCRGGYVLIANPKLVSEIPNELDSILISEGEYNSATTALALEGVQAERITVKKPMDAYVDFVGGKIKYFLGTQRDINRLERRGVEVISKPLAQYNDLYQYLSITTTEPLKKYYSEKFIEFLLLEQSQKTLQEIGMFGVETRVDYENEHLTKMQNVKQEQTISAFITKHDLDNLSENALAFLRGEKEGEIKIKNMLV